MQISHVAKWIPLLFFLGWRARGPIRPNFYLQNVYTLSYRQHFCLWGFLGGLLITQACLNRLVVEFNVKIMYFFPTVMELKEAKNRGGRKLIKIKPQLRHREAVIFGCREHDCSLIVLHALCCSKWGGISFFIVWSLMKGKCEAAADNIHTTSRLRDGWAALVFEYFLYLNPLHHLQKHLQVMELFILN